MRALRWHGRGDVRVEDLPPLGRPGSGWVRLRVEVCGICGTDMEEYVRGPVVTPLEPHPLSGACAPLTMGHEVVGVVAEVGPGVDPVALPVGQRVAVDGHLFCGTCAACRRGDYALCDVLASLGQMADGGLAEEMLAPAQTCLPYADGLTPTRAALAEPLSVVVRAVRRAAYEPGATVAVVGAGTIGLLLTQVARLRGAGRVLVVEPWPARRALALQFGAAAAVPPADADAALRDLTGGVGCDVVFEATGKADVVRAAVGWTRRGGRTVVLGVTTDQLRLDLLPFLLDEKSLVASLSHTYDVDYPEALRLLERGEVEVDPLVTDRIALSEVVSRGFEALRDEPGEHLKILVEPHRR